MKTLKTYNFVSERVKIKPITNAEWDDMIKDAAKQKENVLYVLWPARFVGVDNISCYIGEEMDSAHKVTNKNGQSIFIFKKDTISQLIDKNLVKSSDHLYIMNPNLSEEEIRNVITCAYDHIPMYDFLDDKNNARNISIEEFQNNISWN